MAHNHRLWRWPLRRFVVVEDSMRPTLNPGDGLLGRRGGRVRTGQVRIFRDPTLAARWLVKRVGQVHGSGRDATFEACSDNPDAVGVVDSRRFGPVAAADTYRMVFKVRGAGRRRS
jgi:hypothetical protein